MYPMTIVLLQAGEQQPNSLLTFLPFLLMIVVLYFFLIRPQSKRQKKHQEMLKQIQSGDEVVTIGGIHGKVAGVRDQDNTIILKAGDIKLTIDRAAVSRVESKADGSDVGDKKK
ncbi:preprotein translocase subunit YajC [bacterium]|nr:preprotein translocase subunit YajC [bacterium]